jgi:hypothetical protein
VYCKDDDRRGSYRPGFPQRFDNIEHARAFCRTFFDWYTTSTATPASA